MLKEIFFKKNTHNQSHKRQEYTLVNISIKQSNILIIFYSLNFKMFSCIYFYQNIHYFFPCITYLYFCIKFQKELIKITSSITKIHQILHGIKPRNMQVKICLLLYPFSISQTQNLNSIFNHFANVLILFLSIS